jgi:aldose 1-epimerase
MRAIALEAGALRLVVLPELGGGIARFDLARANGIDALFRPWDGAGADPNGLGCYVLCPFSNRISRGGIEAGGQFWPLAPNLAGEPYPIHGDAWQRPWTVLEASGSTLVLGLESGSMPPFAYRAQLSYELADQALRARLTVQHMGELPVPYGLGFHPWLPRTPATTLQAAAEAVWLERPDHLPDRSLPVTERPDQDFRSPRPLPRSWINNGFVGWPAGRGCTGRNVRSGSRSRRARRFERISCSRRAPMPVSFASSRSRTRSTHSTCRAGRRRMV